MKTKHRYEILGHMLDWNLLPHQKAGKARTGWAMTSFGPGICNGTSSWCGSLSFVQ